MTTQTKTARVIAFIVIALAVVVAYCYSDNMKYIFAGILKSSKTQTISSLIILAVYIFHSFCAGTYKGLLGDKWAEFIFETISEIITVWLCMWTSLIMGKGVYMQQYFNEIYFTQFSSIDIGAITMSSFVLSIYSFRKVANKFLDAIRDVQSVTPEEVSD